MWERFVPFLQFPPVVRMVICTTSSIGLFKNELCKAARKRVQFINDESALKSLWLMVCTIEDRRAAIRVKDGKRVVASGRLFRLKGGKVSGGIQVIDRLAVAYS